MNKRLTIGILLMGTLIGVSMSGARFPLEPVQVWVAVGVPSPQPIPTPGHTFTTELDISAWNGVPGAIELTIQHDPNVFELIDVSFTEESPFPDCFADLTTTSIGKTHLGCFRSTTSDSSAQPMASFSVMTWKIIRTIAPETDIALEVTRLVEARWRSVEVHTFGQHFDFSGDTGTDEMLLPTRFRLGHNYPNPFNSSTTLSYELPEQTYVRIRVYNLLGQIVATLVSEEQPPGHYEVPWNGTGDANMRVSSGVYFYTLETPAFTQSRKMLLIK